MKNNKEENKKFNKKQEAIEEKDFEEKKENLKGFNNKKREPDQKIEEYFEEKNYYCKDLDLFVVMEPCIMCSMALGFFLYIYIKLLMYF